MKFLTFFGVLLAAGLVASSPVASSLEELEEQYRLVQELLEEETDPQERINLSAMGSWLKQQAGVLASLSKQALMSAGGQTLLQKGKELILSKVQVDSLTCENQLCKSCMSAIIPPLNGKPACVEFGLTADNTVRITFSFNGTELLNRTINLESLTANCVSLPFPVGDVCLQGLKKQESESVCVVAVVKQFNIGRELCVTYVDGKLVPSINAANSTIPVAVQDNQLFKLAETGVKLISGLGINV